MTDKLSKIERSLLMSRIRGKDTQPELLLRTLLHGLGYRYRLHRDDLPGKPDLVFPSRKKVIFVNGCYWHRHRCRKGRSVPSSRQKFWLTKFEVTQERDRDVRRQLRRMGWRVFTVWECELKDCARVVELCVQFLEYD